MLHHFREVWYPRVFDRRMYPVWVEAVREVACQALAAHAPSPLPSAGPAPV